MTSIKINDNAKFRVEKVYNPGDVMEYGVKVTIIVDGRPETYFMVDPDIAHELAVALNVEAMWSLNERAKRAVLEDERKLLRL